MNEPSDTTAVAKAFSADLHLSCLQACNAICSALELVLYGQETFTTVCVCSALDLALPYTRRPWVLETHWSLSFPVVDTTVTYWKCQKSLVLCEPPENYLADSIAVTTYRHFFVGGFIRGVYQRLASNNTPPPSTRCCWVASVRARLDLLTERTGRSGGDE